MQNYAGNILVIGASSNPSRISYKAVQLLIQKKYNVLPVGKSAGEIADIPILAEPPVNCEIDTVLLYLNANNQKVYYNYLLKLKPRQIVFNPGAENEELYDLANNEGIDVQMACSLVLIIGDML